ncbi:MAG: HAD family hydrolase [Candidatus Nanohaloarchaea archaeon]
MKYNSVIFDMDGVVLDFRGNGFRWKYDAVRKVLKNHGVDPEGFSREKLGRFLGDHGVKSCVEACNAQGVDSKDVWTDIAEETSRRRAEKMKEGDFMLFEEVRDTLKTLKNQEVVMGLISNAPEMAIRETINFFDLKSFFRFYRGIENFEDLSDRKPHPDHLNFAKAELKRSPYLYVGDHESDIEAARRAEMDSLWINRGEGSKDTEPTYERKSIGELPDIVKER